MKTRTIGLSGAGYGQALSAAAMIVAFLAFASGAGAQVYSIGNPTNEQQYMLELINRARANGGAEAARLGLAGGLQEGPPTINGESWTIQNTTQPLSWNTRLFDVAQAHAVRLNNADQFFLGVSPHTFGGMTPQQRIAAGGYTTAAYNGPTTASGFFPGPENVAAAESQGSGPFTGARLVAGVLSAHNDLFTDQTVPGRGHRNTTTLAFFREAGIGISAGTDNQANPGQPGGPWDSLYIVQNFGNEAGSTPFVTGVVYRDANGNAFYDPGEGIGGVSVAVTGSTFSAVSAASGGYSVPVPGNGGYTVNFSGGGVPAAQRMATVAGGNNVKVDYLAIPGLTRGDFNGDGFTDFLLFNASIRRTAIWNLQGNTFLSGAYGPTLPSGWAVVCVADVNRDDKQDYVLFKASTRQTAIWFLNGGTFVSGSTGPTLPAGWALVACGDVNGDGRPDYVLFNASTRQTAFWYLNGTARIGTAFGATLPANWRLVDAQDFNNNGKPDFVLSNSSTRQTAIWYLNGTALVNGASGPTLPSGWTLQGTADFNSNGKPDYVLYNAGTRQTAIWYLNGVALVNGAPGPTLPSGYLLASP